METNLNALRQEARKKLLKNAKITQKTQSEEIGYSEAMVSLWVNGYSNSQKISDKVRMWVDSNIEITPDLDELTSLMKTMSILLIPFYEAPLTDELIKQIQSPSYEKGEMGPVITDSQSDCDDEGWETLEMDETYWINKPVKTIFWTDENGTPQTSDNDELRKKFRGQGKL